MLFFYYLFNMIWKVIGNCMFCVKLFGLNKVFNGIDLFYEIDMFEVMFIGYFVGIVFVKVIYGNYLVVY